MSLTLLSMLSLIILPGMVKTIPNLKLLHFVSGFSLESLQDTESCTVCFGLCHPCHKGVKLFLTPSHVRSVAKLCCCDCFWRWWRYGQVNIVMCHHDGMMIRYVLHNMDFVIQKHCFVRQTMSKNSLCMTEGLLVMYYIIKVLSCRNFILSENWLCMTEWWVLCIT